MSPASGPTAKPAPDETSTDSSSLPSRRAVKPSDASVAIRRTRSVPASTWSSTWPFSDGSTTAAAARCSDVPSTGSSRTRPTRRLTCQPTRRARAVDALLSPGRPSSCATWSVSVGVGEDDEGDPEVGQPHDIVGRSLGHQVSHERRQLGRARRGHAVVAEAITVIGVHGVVVGPGHHSGSRVLGRDRIDDQDAWLGSAAHLTDHECRQPHGRRPRQVTLRRRRAPPDQPCYRSDTASSAVTAARGCRQPNVPDWMTRLIPSAPRPAAATRAPWATRSGNPHQT